MLSAAPRTLRYLRALPTIRVHPELDERTLDTVHSLNSLRGIRSRLRSVWGINSLTLCFFLQVAIGTISPEGPADLNGKLRCGDEIHYVNRMSVIGSKHHRVTSLIRNAKSSSGKITLGIHRNPARSESK